MKKLNILLQGYIVRGPLGGMTWHHINYFLGLRKLGHTVYFIEDSDDYEKCCYNPITYKTGKDSIYGLQYATAVFNKIDAGNKWAYFNKHINSWQGPAAMNIKSIIASADILINISIVNLIRPWLERIPVRIAIDTDPAFTQIQNINERERNDLTASHTHFFTFAENIGQNDCSIPDDGFKWMPTRQPVFLDEWPSRSFVPGSKWTTMMVWKSYESLEHDGRKFEMKARSFEPYLTLPKLIGDEEIELSLGNNESLDIILSNNWIVTDPIENSIDPWIYRDFIGNSKGEWSVAKHGYVSTNSGWFSERSACYLASGKPVVVQETGFSKFLPSGNGLLSFNYLEEAVDQLKKVRSDYSHQCKWARQIAEEYFNSDIIINNLLKSI